MGFVVLTKKTNNIFKFFIHFFQIYTSTYFLQKNKTKVLIANKVLKIHYLKDLTFLLVAL